MWESVLDDEPASFKASRDAVSSAFDEIDDLPPPPRAAIQSRPGSRAAITVTGVVAQMLA